MRIGARRMIGTAVGVAAFVGPAVIVAGGVFGVVRRFTRARPGTLDDEGLEVTAQQARHRMRYLDQYRERGASAVEYGLLVAAVAVVIVGVVFGLGGLIKGAFSTTSTSIEKCSPDPSQCPAPAGP